MNLKRDVDVIMDDICMSEEMERKILDATARKQCINGGMNMRKRIIVGALAAVLCIGTVTVGAKGISNLWDVTFSKMFSIDENNKEELVDKGDVQIVDKEVVTGDDIEASVKMTYAIADGSSLRFYFEVKSDDVDNMANLFNGFDKVDIMVDGENISPDGADVTKEEIDEEILASTLGQKILRNPDKESEYDCGVLFTLQMDKKDVTGKEIQVKLYDIVMQTYTIEGEWEFSHVIRKGTEPKVFELDSQWTRKKDEVQEEDFTYNLKKIIISPFTYTIEYQVVGEVDTTGVWGLDGTDFNNIPITIVLKDGTVYEDNNIEGKDTIGESSLTYTNETEIRSFYKPIDIEQIDYVIVNGQKVK